MGGGGVVADFFQNQSHSLDSARFCVFCAFSGHLRIVRRLWTLAESSRTLPMSASTFKPRNNINSFRKKTFTSLGGPWPPWPPPGYATDPGHACSCQIASVDPVRAQHRFEHWIYVCQGQRFRWYKCMLVISSERDFCPSRHELCFHQTAQVPSVSSG